MAQGKVERLGESLLELSRRDLVQLAPLVAALIRREAAVHWWIDPEVYRAFERAGIHVSQVSYYSPLPSVEELDRSTLFDRSIGAAESLFRNVDVVAPWLDASRWIDELQDVPQYRGDAVFGWGTDFFPNVDAILYYGLIRRRQPRRVLEIGGGFSSQMARRALEKNGEGRLLVVEPYPSPAVLELDGRIDLVAQPVQAVPMEHFEQLGPGDILFVDSSHVSKTGSDLNHILFEVLPRLDPEVYLHFHDIFLPSDYPRQWCVERGWAWNEQYLLLAYLIGQPTLRILCSAPVLLARHEELVRSTLARLPEAGPPSGSSLWLAPTWPADGLAEPGD